MTYGELKRMFDASGGSKIVIKCFTPDQRASVLQFFQDQGFDIGHRTDYFPGGTRYNDMRYCYPSVDMRGNVSCYMAAYLGETIPYDSVADLIDSDSSINIPDKAVFSDMLDDLMA